MRIHFSVGTIALLFCCTAMAANAAEKPIVYNHQAEAPTEIDEMVLKAYTPHYQIKTIDSKGYERAKLMEGNLVRVTKGEDGKFIGGYVLIGYVINTEGKVELPMVLESTDERLGDIALKSMKPWRFAPSKLNDGAIPTLAGQEFNFHATPTEFETQLLEPFGGKIKKPKEWHYKEEHGGPKYSWVISKEPVTEKKGYATGIRIEVFGEIKKNTGKTAQEFIQDIFKNKKAEADKVIKSTQAQDQGLFTRICMETEEGSFHILYSLFWGSSGMDMAVVFTAGTPKDLWEVYAPTFNAMNGFELIDMSRFEKKKDAENPKK